MRIPQKGVGMAMQGVGGPEQVTVDEANDSANHLSALTPSEDRVLVYPRREDGLYYNTLS
jgi:hypothetical protein